MRGQALGAVVVAAGKVTGAGALDLDHPRALVGQLAGCERGGDGVFQRHHGHAGSPPFTRFQQIRRQAGIGLAIGPPFMQGDVVLHAVLDMAQGQRQGGLAAQHGVQAGAGGKTGIAHAEDLEFAPAVALGAQRQGDAVHGDGPVLPVAGIQRAR